MLWRVSAWCVLAVLISGCVTEGSGLDFASTTQKMGPPRAGVVLLREQSIKLGSFDVKLDGTPLTDLKSGTYVYADTPRGPID